MGSGEGGEMDGLEMEMGLGLEMGLEMGREMGRESQKSGRLKRWG